MDTKEEITAKILGIIETELNWHASGAEITADAQLGSEGLGLDSVMIISMVVELEETFEITVSDEDVVGLSTMTTGQIAEYVQRSMLNGGD